MVPPINEWAVAAIVAITPVVVAILVWITDSFKKNIPSWLKPLVASGLGSLVIFLGSVVTDNPVLIAAIGLATVGLREVIVRLGDALGLRK
jgi:hypothetical protein